MYITYFILSSHSVTSDYLNYGEAGIYAIYERDLGLVYVGLSKANVRDRILTYKRELKLDPVTYVRHSSAKHHRLENPSKQELYFRWMKLDDPIFKTLPELVLKNLDAMIALACKENIKISGYKPNVYNIDTYDTYATNFHSYVGNIVNAMSTSILSFD